MTTIDKINATLKKLIDTKASGSVCLNFLNDYLEQLMIFSGEIDYFEIDRPNKTTIEFKCVIDEYEYGRGLLLDTNELVYAWYVMDDRSKNNIPNIDANIDAYDRAMRGI